MAEYVASHLKDMNRQKVYNLICSRESISRVDITRETGVSAPTVMKIVDYLAEAGLVSDIGTGNTALGRRPQLFVHNPNRYHAIGVILEGNYLKAGIANLDCEISAFRRIKAKKPVLDVLQKTIYHIIDELLEESDLPTSDLLGIGIGLPGIYDTNKHEIRTAPLIGVTQPLNIESSLRALSEHYALPVTVENDLNMEVQGEFQAHRFGSRDDLVYISLGTGLGCGVMLNGKLRRGRNDMCGEIGYMSFLDDYEASNHSSGWLENRINLSGLKERFDIEDNKSISKEMLETAIAYISIPMALCINNIVMCYDSGNVALGGEVFDLLGNQLFEEIQQKVSKISVADVRLFPKKCREPGIAGAVNMVNERQIKTILQK